MYHYDDSHSADDQHDDGTLTISNDAPGWTREETTWSDGSRYISDSHINEEGEFEYHD